MNKIKFFKTIIYIGIVCSFIVMGCNQDDDPIVPSEGLPVKYILPQGNEKYDTLILDFYNEHETFILYDYGKYDPFWNVREVTSGYRVVLPQKEYLEAGINSMFDLWLDLYPADFFKGRLPHYIYLADSIVMDYPTMVITKSSMTTDISMTFAGIGEGLLNMTTTTANTFRQGVNNAFWEYIIDRGRFEVPEVFDMDYSSITTLTDAYNAGLIHGTYRNMNKREDFKKTLDFLLKTSQLIIDMRFRSYPACKTRVQLFVDEMKHLYGIDLELVTGKVLPHSEE